MTELTDKLKARELYYVKKKNGKIVIRQAHLYSCLRTENSMPFVDFEDNDIEEVLAPVPSYDEWQRIFHYAGKDLLREWVQFEVEENPNDFTVISERMSELANKTKQAIGEK